MPVVWSTQEVDMAEQFSYWRHAISSAFVPLEPEEQPSPKFNGSISSSELTILRATTVAADSHSVQLTKNGISRQGGNPFFVNFLRRGHVAVMQNGEVQQAGPGDIYIVDSSAPWTVAFQSEFDMFCIELDEAVLRPRLGTRGKMVAPVLPGNSSNNALLARYLALVSELHAEDACDTQPLILEHCAALIGRANAGANSTQLTVRDHQMMLRRLFAYIDAHLTNPSLCVEQACQDLHVSRSHLFKLLAGVGETFSGHVRSARLHGARGTLLRHPEMPVAQIAANWGFADTSSFNRAFRNRFGVTPSQSRMLGPRSALT
jgi:AraC family transcriptional activator of tynA and feaB